MLVAVSLTDIILRRPLYGSTDELNTDEETNYLNQRVAEALGQGSFLFFLQRHIVPLTILLP